jgi:hypothetical protein
LLLASDAISPAGQARAIFIPHGWLTAIVKQL